MAILFKKIVMLFCKPKSSNDLMIAFVLFCVKLPFVLESLLLSETWVAAHEHIAYAALQRKRDFYRRTCTCSQWTICKVQQKYGEMIEHPGGPPPPPSDATAP